VLRKNVVVPFAPAPPAVRLPGLAVLLLAVLWLGGCSTTFNSALIGRSFAVEEEVGSIPAANAPAPAGTVLAPPGDLAFDGKLAIDPAPVRFSTDDQFRFSVFGHVELLHDATVMPDGTVLLPLVGTLRAAGRTPDELRAEATRLLRAKLHTDRVSLQPADVVTMSVWQHPELTHIGTVQLDGMLTLPIVGEIRAAGRPVRDVQREVAGKLRSVLQDPLVSILPNRLANTSLADAQISILPLKLQPRIVAILGEVAAPGLYPVHSRMRVMNLVAQARNLDTGQLNDVIVIRGRTEGKPRYRSLRLADFAAGRAPNDNIYLAADDIVLIPKSPVAAMGVFIDQFFGKTVGLFNWWVSLNDAMVATETASTVRLLNRTLRTTP
jgi:protein involved in polysaccharide export with SLBB domain